VRELPSCACRLKVETAAGLSVQVHAAARARFRGIIRITLLSGTPDRMTGLFSKDGLPLLLLGVSLGVGFGATYGSEYQEGFPAIGVTIGVVLGVIGAFLLDRYLPKPPAQDSSAKSDTK
jgi:hypothetical protein